MMTNNDMLPETEESTEVLGMKGVLKEASRLPFNNVKHMIINVLLLLPIAFLCIFHRLAILLFRKEVLLANDDFSAVSKLIIFIFSFGAYFFLIFQTTLFGVILTMHHISDLYTRKSSKVMELFSRIATIWKKIASS